MSGTVRLSGQAIPVPEGSTVLEALEAAGVEAASGCRAGTCCKCMLRSDAPPKAAQRGLRPTLQAQGYFLACQAYVDGEVAIDSGAAPDPIVATLVSKELVAEDVVRVLLKPDQPLEFRPGQYLDVIHPTGASRSYSIASLPETGHLELHVRHVPNGLVSGWIHGLALGTKLSIRGAFGQCFHVADDADKKMLLVGAGTGLAPLLGIARDALESGHRGPIDLVHGGLTPGRLYMRRELADLAAEYPQLSVHHCVLKDATNAEHEGPLDRVAIELAGPLGATRAFLCGDGGIVKTLQRSLFLAGVPSAEILSDPFVATP